jgi:hypothetical protein
MSFFRYNRILLSHLTSPRQTRFIIPNHPSSIIVRHATEIRSRKPVKTDSSPKQRKNTINPIAQVRKLGVKAGRVDLNQFLLINLIGISIYLFSQYPLE